MSLLNRVISKCRIEIKFYLEQKLGLRKPLDPINIPKCILRTHLPVSPVIIDCGAHIGSDSIELARVFKKSTVYSFEAVPAVYQKLVYATRKHPNIWCFNTALSSVSGSGTMYVSSGGSDGSSSLLEPDVHLTDHPDVSFEKSIQVRTLTLDDWASENAVVSVDLLWLDMQGAEFLMLQASRVILRTIRAIHTEVSMRDTYKGVVKYRELRQWLEDRGFVVACEALPEGWDMGNVLFVRHQGDRRVL
jgi:FkbM family methyltransferase